ncbi:unnamed protein product [Rotaria sp. Silwood2]|nr:unnamed protein product [Rotaria sp. Silwood2]CAF3268051.1 unnamed protein product [Rotaria sp. Silwood2]CAF4173098.1 unnamed protein product [Rotaria sp. Silwood2]CAF4192470.1 unnamed protein product [Rotaria sp. Silwood2]
MKSDIDEKNIDVTFNSYCSINVPVFSDSKTWSVTYVGVNNLVSMNDDDRILKDVIENNDNEFIFAPLDINQDKPNERNSNNNNTAEDISNDGIYLALQDSIKDRQT